MFVQPETPSSLLTVVKCMKSVESASSTVGPDMAYMVETCPGQIA